MKTPTIPPSFDVGSQQIRKILDGAIRERVGEGLDFERWACGIWDNVKGYHLFDIGRFAFVEYVIGKAKSYGDGK